MRHSCFHEVFRLALQRDQDKRRSEKSLKSLVRPKHTGTKIHNSVNLICSFSPSPLTFSQYNYSDLMKRLLIYLPLHSSSRQLRCSLIPCHRLSAPGSSTAQSRVPSPEIPI